MSGRGANVLYIGVVIGVTVGGSLPGKNFTIK